MIGYVTYKAAANGFVELKTSSAETWTAVGSIVGDNGWHTAVLFAQGVLLGQGQGGGPGVDVRTFHDHYGDAFVNADMRFNVANGVTLDAMWVDIDHDGDNLTSFGEPQPYATEDNTLYILQPSQYVDKNWEVLTEGRWQFDISLVLHGSSGPPPRYSAITTSVDGVEIGNVRKNSTGVDTESWRAMLCTGPRKFRIASNGDNQVDVTQIAFRKLPTDPMNPDTDGDGLRDG